MATPCLSRLLLILLLGAINVVAHPMNKDKPTESGNAVVQESPSLEWKPKEENHKHSHVHHGIQESTVTFQKITVKLDDKDGPKHKSDADKDEESTKTEYPSKASAKHGEIKGTTHNHKDAKRSDWAVKRKLTDEEVDEMERLAKGYTLLTRKEKIKLEMMFKVYQHMKEEEEKLEKSNPGSAKESKDYVLDEAGKEKDYKAQLDKFEKNEGYKPRKPKDDVFVKAPKEKDYKAQLDNIEKYKDNKPKDPKYNIFDEARKQKDNKAQLDNIEKNEDYKPKDARPWWALPSDKHDQAKHHRNGLASTGEKGVEAKGKITKRCEEILPWWVQLILKKVRKDKAKKKEKEEEEERKNLEQEGRLGRRNGQLHRPPLWSRLLHRSPYVKPNKSIISKLYGIKEMEEKLPNAPQKDKPKDWAEDKTNKAFDKKPSEEKEPLNVGAKFNDDKPSSSALQQKKDKEDKQKSEVQPNKASGDSKDEDSNQSKRSLTARFFPPRPPRPPFPSSEERKRRRRLERERRIQKAYENYIRAQQSGKPHEIWKAYAELVEATKWPYGRSQRGQRGNPSRGRTSAKSKHQYDIDDGHSNRSKSSLTRRFLYVPVPYPGIKRRPESKETVIEFRKRGQPSNVKFEQKSEVQPNTASEDSKDGHSNQNKTSLTGNGHPRLPPGVKRPSQRELERLKNCIKEMYWREKRLKREGRIWRAYENYIGVLKSGNLQGLAKAQDELARAMYAKE